MYIIRIITFSFWILFSAVQLLNFIFIVKWNDVVDGKYAKMPSIIITTKSSFILLKQKQNKNKEEKEIKCKRRPRVVSFGWQRHYQIASYLLKFCHCRTNIFNTIYYYYYSCYYFHFALFSTFVLILFSICYC